MANAVASERAADVLFHSIREQTYPEDEAVTAAELPSSAVQKLGELLSQARQEVKTSICELSRLSAPDVDGWIEQAKQLRDDIRSSEEQATSISALTEQGDGFARSIDDAAAKAQLLESELVFSQTLGATLQDIRNATASSQAALDATGRGDYVDAIALIRKSERELEDLPGSGLANITELVGSRSSELKGQIAEALTHQWHDCLYVDSAESVVRIRSDLQGTPQQQTLIQGLNSLGLLDAQLEHFSKTMSASILKPLLEQPIDTSLSNGLEPQGDTLRIRSKSRPFSMHEAYAELETLNSYLSARLPQSIAPRLFASLTTEMADLLLSKPLPAAIPPDTFDLASFKSLLQQTDAFINRLPPDNTKAQQRLRTWIHEAPQHWLAKQSARALDSARQILKRGLGNPRSVERVETQVIASDDQVFSATQAGDDWNAGWGEEDESLRSPTTPKSTKSPVNGHAAQEDEDVSAWGFDDDEQDTEQNVTKLVDTSGEDEDADAWGWNEDDQPQTPAKTPRTATSTAKASLQVPRTPKTPLRKQAQEQTVTLREMYNITAVPEQLLEILVMTEDDAKQLARSPEDNPVRTAADGMYQLPELLLSMYRATAPTLYARHENGNMFLYNDCFFLAQQLESFPVDEAHELSAAITAVQTFGTRTYLREMDSQRTILIDLLDGAQGFAQCSEQPFAEACDIAVDSVVDRLRAVHQQWKDVLSRSTLLQATGSLLNTIANKIIVDICDMSDISEPESQRLAELCQRIIKLDDIFLPERPADSAPDETVIPLTAGYVSSWLKLQYLVNVLESSLIDIKYLWTDGELSLEFRADEIVDLIEALFADSDHRRKAIADIRRTQDK